jgi:hypothetical protein
MKTDESPRAFDMLDMIETFDSGKLWKSGPKL